MFVQGAINAVAIMWVMVAISLVMVLLRLYTRYFIVKAVGLDDHIFWISWIFLLMYTIFLTISGKYGFAQNLPELSLDDGARAVFMELIGQTFAVIGMALAKISLGIFLIRVVIKTWHKVAIATACALLSTASISVAIIIWVQCVPAKRIWDPMRTPGECNVPITPPSLVLGSTLATADFFFASFPWLFIWGLNMKQRDKLILAFSMSLGAIAGACGIVRTIELADLQSTNYTKDTVALIVWSAAEQAVTMVCIGLPVLRPLYKKVLNKGGSSNTGKYYKSKTTGGLSSSGFRMENLGSRSHRDDFSQDFDDPLGTKNSTSRTYAVRDNNSDEEILGPEYRQHAIMVREDIRVESGPRR